MFLPCVIYVHKAEAGFELILGLCGQNLGLDRVNACPRALSFNFGANFEAVSMLNYFRITFIVSDAHLKSGGVMSK